MPELADGTGTDIQIDNVSADAINPNGEAKISFEEGNYDKFEQSSEIIQKKISLVKDTVMPLIEVALIELLGNNKAYKGKIFKATNNIDPQTGDFTIEVAVVYHVEHFIGTDIAQEYIQHDAKYILDRVKVVQGVTWNKCEVDCTEGSVNINFSV